MRLHRQYGYGLTGIYKAASGLNVGEVRPDDDPTNNQPKTNKDGTQTYNGVTFNPKDERTFILGAVAGL